VADYVRRREEWRTGESCVELRIGPIWHDYVCRAGRR
jgi:hypothetical protein